MFHFQQWTFDVLEDTLFLQLQSGCNIYFSYSDPTFYQLNIPLQIEEKKGSSFPFLILNQCLSMVIRRCHQFLIAVRPYLIYQKDRRFFMTFFCFYHSIVVSYNSQRALYGFLVLFFLRENIKAPSGQILRAF